MTTATEQLEDVHYYKHERFGNMSGNRQGTFGNATGNSQGVGLACHLLPPLRHSDTPLASARAQFGSVHGHRQWLIR